MNDFMLKEFKNQEPFPISELCDFIEELKRKGVTHIVVSSWEDADLISIYEHQEKQIDTGCKQVEPYNPFQK